MSSSHLCFLILYCFAFHFAISSSSATIPPGSTLYASNRNQTWSSPSSTFSLHFIPSGVNSFAAVITHLTGVTVWSVGGGNGTRAVVDSGGALHLLPTGVLRLTNGSGTTVWDSGTANHGVSHAALDDSGNLLLLSNSGLPVWSSFEYPTDTIVPSQNFTSSKNLRSGSYSFSLLSSGNLTLKWKDRIEYWSQGFNSSIAVNLTSPRLVLQSNGILMSYDSSVPGGVITAYSTDYGEGDNVFRFLRLDSDGNLRIYSATSENNGTVSWAAVLDQCLVFGYCGNLGICSYINENPICSCPSQNFEPVDVNDGRKGCKRKAELEDCQENVTTLELGHTKFLTYPPEVSSQNVVIVGIEACRSNCLVSLSCVASTSLADGTGSCYMKMSDFVTGYQSPSLPSSSFMKVCGPVLPNPLPVLENAGKGRTWKSDRWIICALVAAAFLIFAAFWSGFWWYSYKHGSKFGSLQAKYALLEYASSAPTRFSYKELQQSTKGFGEVLGAGGFGMVYKGILPNKMPVAVKRLEGIEQGEKQFRMEVATISSTHHLNLVRLIGFCADGRHRLLVYEFMKNGSLDNLLFTPDDQSRKLLNWEQRFNIALGTARGITYLHEECRDCIVHCDVKPENILLDECYNAKVSDFGLAKLINPKDHRHLTLTSIRGTRGYLAPEWLANLPITTKSDVYSYGMVLLEIVSGRRNFDVSAETNHRRFSLWAYEEFEKGNIMGIMDKKLSNLDVDIEQVMRAMKVTFWCIQEQPSQRPSMGKVVQMLEGVLEIEMPTLRTVVAEGLVNEKSMTLNSDATTLSTFTSSAPAPSLSSSFQIAATSPLASGRNMERDSSSLLRSQGIEAQT
ncbi:hypothetical protein SLEP1_g4779 [Rubroshorea leprosula]|uniref:Receptor-like serine/threonine-protein kinase n=1 Tax=Rubroshorea leprosula TaxID=152421 RepID=A0AAV5I0A3_9ROSI|nr:hypothetical protein SLEP1_g4779 [Rubroshorea leprosula]